MFRGVYVRGMHLVAAGAFLTSCSGGDRPPAESDNDSSVSPSDSDGSPDKDDDDKDDNSADDDPSDSGDSNPTSSDEDDPGESEDGSENNGEGAKFDLGGLPDFDVNNIGCNIDFLFVVDNSGSMRDMQESLAASVPDFIETMTGEIDNLESYHIGVVSTDEAFFNGPTVGEYCAQIGGLVIEVTDYESNPWNRECAPYANGKNFMTKDDDLEDKFVCAGVLGASGSGDERPMDALRASFSPEMTEAGACNEGFFRKDAILVVVLITDEEDDFEGPGGAAGSADDPEDWHEAVMKFKGDRPEYVVMLSLIGTPEPNECELTLEPGEDNDNEDLQSAEHSPRLIQFTELFEDRGVVGDVCAPNYDPFFEKALSVIELACNELPQG